MFRKMPIILLAVILSVFLIGNQIPEEYQSILYGLSLTIKSFIVCILPFVVFSLLFKTTVQFSNKASKMILMILATVCCSNYLSTMLSYSAGMLAFNFDLSLSFPTEAATLHPTWNFVFPTWIQNDKAMFSGLILGVLLGWLKPTLAHSISSKLDYAVRIILRTILFLIPVFITGFVIKMNHDQLMTYILSNYSVIFILIATALFAYLSLLYFVTAHFQLSKAIVNFKNMLPAAIAGFGSMSSAAAMPLTIMGAEKNSKNPDLARAVIPMTVNIHLIGDCFAIPIFAFAVMKSFGIEEPSLVNYMVFAAYFVLAKFSVAAIPGGGILVMLPILEAHLGFNAEMLSLMTALYILFDPVVTCANIVGNGGFSLAIENFLSVKQAQKTA